MTSGARFLSPEFAMLVLGFALRIHLPQSIPHEGYCEGIHR
jgi:hypothetical protein